MTWVKMFVRPALFSHREITNGLQACTLADVISRVVDDKDDFEMCHDAICLLVTRFLDEFEEHDPST